MARRASNPQTYAILLFALFVGVDLYQGTILIRVPLASFDYVSVMLVQELFDQSREKSRCAPLDQLET